MAREKIGAALYKFGLATLLALTPLYYLATYRPQICWSNGCAPMDVPPLMTRSPILFLVGAVFIFGIMLLVSHMVIHIWLHRKNGGSSGQEYP